MHPERVPAPLVFALLGLISVATAMVADPTVAPSAGHLGAKLKSGPRWRVRPRVAGGATMIGLGGFVAVAD